MKNLLLVLLMASFFTGFSSNSLVSLNVNIRPDFKEIQPGEQVFIEISIVNKAVEKGDVLLKYIVEDKDGNIIDKETETVLLTTRITHMRSLEMPETIKKGKYSFFVELEKDGKNIATASDVFYVGKKPFLTIQNTLIIITALIIITLIVIIYEVRKIRKQIKINENILLKEKLIKLKGGK